jgi:hypothetical protein
MMSLVNPFIYSTPDQIKDPHQAIELFVDVFKDFYLIESIGNTFIYGPRGSGKSMMFRIMKPDCQKIKINKPLNDLNYYAIYVPIKDKALDIEDLSYLKHGENALNEHLLTTYFSISVFKCLEEEDYSEYSSSNKDIHDFYNNSFKTLLVAAGYKGENIPDLQNSYSINDIFKAIRLILEQVQDNFITYIQRLSINPDDMCYSGELLFYKNFLAPIIDLIAKFSFVPQNKPIYILVDDANWLNYTQTKLLNSWV